MQIRKFLLMFCVATLGLSTLQAQRADTEEQAKARELLRKKMAELDAEQQAAQPKPPVQPAPKPTPPKKTKEKKAAPKPEPSVTPASKQHPPARELTGVPPLARPAKPEPEYPLPAESKTNLTPGAEAKAREELHQKIGELDSLKPAPRAATTPAPATAVENSSVVIVPSSKNEKSAKSAPPQKSKPPVAEKKPKKSEKYVFDTPVPTTSVENPIAAGASGPKNQKLSELLNLYRSNAITPEEYHKRRAEILAQP